MHMHTEASAKYNKDVSTIVSKLYSLRCIECSKKSMKKKYTKASPLLKKITQELMDKNNYLLYRPMWEDLHDRMVYYYDYLNRENLQKSIPLFRETLHNDVVKWWLECKAIGKLGSTLIHFDTHDDMGLPSSSKYLLHKGKLYEQGVKEGACGQIYWPITCILLSKAIDHVIWSTPKWIYDDDNGFDQTLVCWKEEDDFSYIRGKDQKSDKFRLKEDVMLMSKKDMEDLDQDCKFRHDHRFDRVKTWGKRGWNKLENIIEGKFILDVDLDFFVTNGDKVSMTEYKHNFNDIESYGRVHTTPGITTPRAVYDDPHSEKVIKLLNKEAKLIKKRVDKFLDGLRQLKNKGLMPSCIDISDSAPSFFSGNTERAVFTNEYTPKYFVPYIHMIFIQGLHEIYGNKFT